MIRPEEKRPDELIDTLLPAAYMEQINAHAKELDDSSPSYVVRAIVMDYFDTGRHQNGGGEKPHSARPGRQKTGTKSKAVPMTQQRGKAVA